MTRPKLDASSTVTSGRLSAVRYGKADAPPRPRGQSGSVQVRHRSAAQCAGRTLSTDGGPDADSRQAGHGSGTARAIPTFNPLDGGRRINSYAWPAPGDSGSA